MAKKTRTPLGPPRCLHCDAPAQLVTGREVYPHRRDLADKPMWKCPACPDSHCGCHPGTTRPLGRPADRKTRDARVQLHTMVLDPLWKNAIVELGYEPEDQKARAIITKVARVRVYAFLANRLGITRDECHTAEFSVERCRDAWRILRDTSYAEVRAWARAEKEKGQDNGKTGNSEKGQGESASGQDEQTESDDASDRRVA